MSEKNDSSFLKLYSVIPFPIANQQRCQLFGGDLFCTFLSASNLRQNEVSDEHGAAKFII